MTCLPTDAGAVLLGAALRDPGEVPWGRGRPTNRASLPCGDCPDCVGGGWIPIPDPFIGGTLDARCPTCGGS